MNWIGGIIVVFIVAAFLNPEWAPLMWSITLILMLVFAITGVVSMVKAMKARRAKTLEEREKNEKYQEYLSEQAAIRAELYPRLNEAFTPIIELQQNLNKALLAWLQQEFEQSDKPEYQTHLKKHIDTFDSLPPSTCNSDFLDVAKAPGESVAVLTMGSYAIEPVEVLDKCNWEKSMAYLLTQRFHEGKGEFSYVGLGRMDFETAKRFISISLADSLKCEHLGAAVSALDLHEAPIIDLIEAVKSGRSDQVQVVGGDRCVEYANSVDHIERRREASLTTPVHES